MNKYMYESMNGLINEWMNEKMDEYMKRCMNGYTWSGWEASSGFREAGFGAEGGGIRLPW